MNPNRLSDLAAGMPVQDWLILGPFVIETTGQFEREYLYERDRILDVDYLEGDGGETTVQPKRGQSHENIGLGPKQLTWRPHPESDLHGMRIAGDLIYETVQRNCVIYAAATIDADHDCTALLDAYHSGMKVWVNGELVCNEPYGLPKGARLTMPSKIMALRKGRNLLLVKFRPGYIADGVDFRVRNLSVSPLVGERNFPISLGRVRALPYFTGSVDEPRQVVEAALVNTSHTTQKVSVLLGEDGQGALDKAEIICDPERLTPVRLSVPTPRAMAGKGRRVTLQARLYGRTVESVIEYQCARPPKYDGTTMVLTDFHFDTTYHEEQRVYAMGAFDIVRQYCRLHRDDPNYRSIISEVDYLKPYFDMFPEDRETLLKAFREKRSEPDVMYNQPNEQNCGGEALVRNFLYGQLFHGQVLGNICHAYGPGDVFGHPNQLSQIVRKSGCMGVTWDKYIYNFPPFFEHLALDGVGIPHKRGPATWDDVHAMGLSVTTGGIDQTPPTDWHATLVPKVQQATYHDLLTAIRRDCEEHDAHLPVTSRDMSLYHAATAMSRTNLKIANRLGENVLLTAERFATIAALLGAKYPEKALDKAWRQILCGQHHDSITGTHNEISYVDLMNSYREVLELGVNVVNRSLDFIGRGIEVEKAERPLVVFNPMGWERTDVVRATVKLDGLGRFAIQDYTGKNVPFEVHGVEQDKRGRAVSAEVTFVARRLPSLGYRAYQIVPSQKPLPERKKTSACRIENEYYRIEVDPARGGGITSLYDKKAKREVLDTAAHHVGNELVALEEVPDRRETQHEFYTTGLKLFSSECPAEVDVEQGPLSATLRARYAMGEICEVVQEITVTKGVPRIDFRTLLLDWQGEDNLFVVTFPTSLKGCVPVFDERFGVVARNASKGYLDFRTHRQCMFSQCGVYAANKWMEYGASALLKAGRSTYALSMIGLITPRNKADVAAAEGLQKRLIKKGVTCTPWYDRGGPHWGSYQDHMDEDLLYTRFRFSLGSRGKNVYSQKLLAAQKAQTRKAFATRLKKNGWACLLVKDSELEDTSWPALPVLIVEAQDAAQLEAALAVLLADFEQTATVRLPTEADAIGEPHRVDDYGVAILNRGTYAKSIEKDGVICMMLAHTCRWYGGTNNFPEGYLVPENKHNVFEYALYPHKGDWREANTQQAGHAYNYPLLARQTQPGTKTCLPPESALVEVTPKNVILAAMKPFGNPIPSFQRDEKADPAKGIMLRLYDTEGVDTEAHISFAAGMRSAWTANLLEEHQMKLEVPDGQLCLPVPANSIETIGFVPNRLGRKIGQRVLGDEAEPVQPVFVRSWEHDAESMPMGYESVVCSISREVREEDDGRTLYLKVNAVNDYTDAEVSGNAELLVPEGWQVEPNEVAFTLPPLGHETTEVRVTRPNASASGQVKLRHTDNGQTFQDVFEVGDCFDLDMSVENSGNAILVTVSNPTSETVEGEVSLVTPIETWPRDLVGTLGLLDISPRTQGISLAAGASTTLKFTVAPLAGMALAAADSYWAVAKLMSNGRIQLKRCGRRPQKRLMDDGKWHTMLETKKEQRRRNRRPSR